MKRSQPQRPNVRCAIITNIPTPYRDPIYALLPGGYSIIFCSRTEANRAWALPPLQYTHVFLEERVHSKRDGITFVHSNPDVWSALSGIRPNVVITTGFNPTHLYAYLWTKVHGTAHVCMTDGTIGSEANRDLCTDWFGAWFTLAATRSLAPATAVGHCTSTMVSNRVGSFAVTFARTTSYSIRTAPLPIGPTMFFFPGNFTSASSRTFLSMFALPSAHAAVDAARCSSAMVLCAKEVCPIC